MNYIVKFSNRLASHHWNWLRARVLRAVGRMLRVVHFSVSSDMPSRVIGDRKRKSQKEPNA
jgi:hypothetical protein